MKKNLTLRQILSSPSVSYALEAHNGISAKIAESSGFPVIWASGFTVSASLGHRDCNEISWTNFLDQVGYIIDSVSVPVLVDGDTGFGNFNNVRQLVLKLGKFNAAGVCLEDKNFPKTNSFLPYNQKLASIDEFEGKIKAAKDSQLNEDFCVIARTEAFIAGLGLEEALKRCYSYRDSGADAIVVHSKEKTPHEIVQFCKQWDFSIPLVIIPTSYAPRSPELYKDLGVSLVIWGNHLMRASVLAMQKIAQSLYEYQTFYPIEKEISSMDSLFKLVNEEELEIAQKKYCF